MLLALQSIYWVNAKQNGVGRNLQAPDTDSSIM
jgi:hypothetical protein